MTIQSDNRRLLWVAAGFIALATLTAGSAQAADPRAITLNPTDSGEERFIKRPIFHLVVFDGGVRIYKSFVYDFNRTLDGRTDRRNRCAPCALDGRANPPVPVPAPREPRGERARTENADGRRSMGG